MGGYTKKDYKPVRRGEIYCAPFCGAKCTHKAFLAATAAGKELAAKLGKGWKARVWENLGWHYSAISPDGRLKVHTHKYPDTPRHYTAFLGSADSSGGRWVARGTTPRAAIRAVLRQALDEKQEVDALVASAKAGLG